MAQTVTGTLQGTVSDSKGAVVPGADVVIRNIETGQAQRQNRKRRNIPRGVSSYRTLHGDRLRPRFQQGRTGKHRGHAESNHRRQLTLNPSSVTEAVVVTSDAAPINTTNSEIKGSLNAQEIIKPTLNQGSFFTGRHVYRLSGKSDERPEQSHRLVRIRSTSTAPAHAARLFNQRVNNDDSSETRTARAHHFRRLKSFKSSLTTSAPSLVAAMEQRWCWSRPSRAPTISTATSTGITTTAL